MTSLTRRVIPAACLLALFAFFSALYIAGAQQTYMTLLRALGFDAFATPFLDLHGVLAAIDCHRLGYDVVATNPCDIQGRPHNYGPVWLLAAATPITRAWLNPLGLALDLAFVAAVTLLPPARGRRELLLITLATLSSSVLYALERANIDLIIYLLATFMAWAALRAPATRLAGFASVFLAALLKFYPASLLILAARERPARCAAICILFVAALAAYVAVEAETLHRALTLIPSGLYFHDRFGARNLPFGLRELGLLPSASAALALQAALTLAALALALFLARAPALDAALDRLTPAEDVFLMVSASLILGCFFTAQNVTYRGILMLFAVPGLTALWHVSADARWRRVFAATSIVAVLLLWEGIFRTPLEFNIATLHDDRLAFLVWRGRQLVWLVRELLWWSFAPLLAAILLRQLARTPTGTAALHCFRPRQSCR